MLGEGFFECLADFGIFDRKNIWLHLDHGHLGAEGIEKIGELDADGAGPDDDDFLWLIFQSHRLSAADHAFAIEGESWHLTGDYACGDEDFCGCIFGFFSGLVGHLDHAGLGNSGFPSDVVHFVFLK